MLEKNTKFHIDNYYVDNPLTYGELTLFQIGRRYCEAGAVIGEHFHKGLFELTIATGGVGRVITNGEPCTVTPGDIFLSFPSELHDIRVPSDKKFEYDFFAFAAEGKLGEELSALAAANPAPQSRIFRDERISYLVALAIAEFSGDGEHGGEMFQCFMKQIIIYILRSFANTERRTANPSDADILCQNIMSYIDYHVYSISSLAEVAEEFKYNYSYISDLFKRTTGNTLSDYYRGRRLEVARSLIEEGKRNLGEISELLGYSTPFAFSAAFKKRFGVSPKSYKPRK